MADKFQYDMLFVDNKLVKGDFHVYGKFTVTELGLKDVLKAFGKILTGRFFRIITVSGDQVDKACKEFGK